MIGPFAKGHWTTRGGDRTFRQLVAGERYAVVRPFTDFDGDVHPVAEEWTFLGAAFLPYDDGQSLFVSLDGDRNGTSACNGGPTSRAKSSTISTDTCSRQTLADGSPRQGRPSGYGFTGLI